MSGLRQTAQMDAEGLVKNLPIKDLRIEARARGLSPAGGAEELRDRIIESMLGNRDVKLIAAAATVTGPPAAMSSVNNYNRPGGQQNVGNFITDRNTSRVLAPPGGGGGQIILGDDSRGWDNPPIPAAAAAPPTKPPTAATATKASSKVASKKAAAPKPAPEQKVDSSDEAAQAGFGTSNNNYVRPGGMQNVGNFLTDRASSRVLAPPGGGSQITLG